jgi:hypothetical protein
MQICQRCNATTDFRVLDGYRCAPMPGYYESNTVVAAACPAGCSDCYSPFLCTACRPNYQLYIGQCVLAISVGSAGCPQGCSTCDPASKTCSACLSGYQLLENSCAVSEFSGTGNIYSVLYGFGAGILTLGTLGMFAFCVYRFRRLKENSDKTSASIGSDVRLHTGNDMSSSRQGRWRARSVLSNTMKDCSVCLKHTTLFMTACGHVMHPECLVKWRV